MSLLSAPTLPLFQQGAGDTIMTENTGGSFNYAFLQPTLHLKNTFSQQETPYISNLSCSVGSANVNNDCLCPGAPTGTPYYARTCSGPACVVPQSMQGLFSPLEPQMFPPLAKSAQLLIAERSPVGSRGNYYPLDKMPLVGKSC